MTEWCWGFGWGDPAIDPKTRSLMNLAMLGALCKMHEWETHCRGALANGRSVDEIPASCHVVAIYCRVRPAMAGFPAAPDVIQAAATTYPYTNPPPPLSLRDAPGPTGRWSNTIYEH